MTTTAPQIKVTAQVAASSLAFGGIAFDDEHLTHADFAALKPTLPLGQLPVFQVDGVVFAQSMVIARYAAKLSGLYPQDAELSLRADMISETLSELRIVYTGIMYRKPDAALKAEKTAKMLAESVPKVFGVLERMVAGPFFLGANASLADLQLFDAIVNGLQPNFPAFALDAAAYPKLQAVLASVQASANIAAYVASQKK